MHACCCQTTIDLSATDNAFIRTQQLRLVVSKDESFYVQQRSAHGRPLYYIGLPEIGAKIPYQQTGSLPQTAAPKYSMCYSLLETVSEKFGTKLHVRRVRDRYLFWRQSLVSVPRALSRSSSTLQISHQPKGVFIATQLHSTQLDVELRRYRRFAHATQLGVESCRYRRVSIATGVFIASCVAATQLAINTP